MDCVRTASWRCSAAFMANWLVSSTRTSARRAAPSSVATSMPILAISSGSSVLVAITLTGLPLNLRLLFKR